MAAGMGRSRHRRRRSSPPRVPERSWAASSASCSASRSSVGPWVSCSRSAWRTRFILPGFVVSRRARARRDELRAQLPDALDLLAVSVEAGLAFDGAVAKLTEHMEGALAEEFSHTLGEMRIGESRHDALKKLSDRARLARDLELHPGDHPGRPARHLARPPPPRPGLRVTPQASGRCGGEGDEVADQDALPDRDLHLPGDVHRHPRARDAQPDDVSSSNGRRPRSGATRPSRASAPASGASSSGGATRKRRRPNSTRMRRSGPSQASASSRRLPKSPSSSRPRTSATPDGELEAIRGRAGPGDRTRARRRVTSSPTCRPGSRRASPTHRACRCARRRSTLAQRRSPPSRPARGTRAGAGAARRSGGCRAAAARRPEVRACSPPRHERPRASSRSRPSSVSSRPRIASGRSPRRSSPSRRRPSPSASVRSNGARRGRREGSRGSGAGRGARSGARHARGASPRAGVRGRRSRQGSRRARARARQGPRDRDGARGAPARHARPS